MQNTEFRTGVIKPLECAKEAWAIIKPDFWLMLAILIVGSLVGTMTLYVTIGAMICGINFAYLRKIDGQEVAFDDLWKGFSWFGSSLVVALFILVPLFIVWGVIYIPIVLTAVMGQGMSENELWTTLASAFALDALLVVLITCFHTLLMFSFPLIVDRGLGAIPAMLLSAKAVWKNLTGVCGLILIDFALAILGELAFCIGIYVAIPIIFATNLVAYRKVFQPKTFLEINMPAKVNLVNSIDRLERLFAASHVSPVLLFKHSDTCGISHHIYEMVAEIDGEINIVVVQNDRLISNIIAERLGIRHASPQAFVLWQGRPIYHATHYGIEPKDIESKLAIK